MIDLKNLIKSGVQFGHQTWRWNPKMSPYIWGHKNGIHLIDVSKTAFQLERAAQFLSRWHHKANQFYGLEQKNRLKPYCLRFLKPLNLLQ